MFHVSMDTQQKESWGPEHEKKEKVRKTKYQKTIKKNNLLILENLSDYPTTKHCSLYTIFMHISP